MNEPIIIAGAGPVGLVTALLLHRQGREVRVFEAVRELRPLGVGINLLPHSVRVLDSLGLSKYLDDIAIRTAALHYYNKFGQRIWAEPRGLDAGYPYPQYSVHRGRLQLMLLERVRAELGKDAIVTGHRLVDWQDRKDGIEASFERSDDSRVEVSGHCLIAADGINSTARARLYPDEGPAIYGGRILWRGITEAAPYLDGRTMFMAGYQDRKFVAYPISHLENGNAMINWIAELAVPDYVQGDQDWNREVSTDVFKGQFSDWDFGWVNIPAIIDGCDKVFEFPLSDRDPLPQWRQGRMTLIGDAAHPMYPIGSNGASQGILDAEKLVQELSRSQPLEEALDAYELERRPATAKIVLSNRQNGPEQVMQMAEDRAPKGFINIEDVISRAELEEVAARYKQTAGFSVQAVKEKSNS